MTIEDLNTPDLSGGDDISTPDAGGGDPFDQGTLDAIYDELTKGEGGETDAPLAPVDKTRNKQADTGAGKADKANAGDAADKGSTEGDPATAAPDNEDSADQPNEKDGEQPQAAIAAPNSWSAEMKEKWGDVSPEVQAYIAQRDTESHREITRMGQEIAQFKPIGELLSTKQDVFDRHGLTPSEGIKTLLDAQERLDADPAGALAAIAESFGIDLAATYGGLNTDQVTDANARQVFNDLQAQNQNLAAQNRQLQQQLAQEQNRITARQAREAEIVRHEAEESVSKFAADKPYFEKVRGTMGQLLQQHPGATLDQLYDMACHADPDIRKELSATQQKSATEEQRREQAKVAADAKRQPPVNTRQRRTQPVASNSWDDDAALSAAYDRVVSNG